MIAVTVLQVVLALACWLIPSAAGVILFLLIVDLGPEDETE